MKIHAIIHAPHEELGNIYNWIELKGFTVTKTHLYQNEKLPSEFSDIDFLIIMGGPMGVYDEKEFPWLVEEKKFIDKAIKSNIKILGICLGAQLLACVLGAKVRKNKVKEIGWHLVKFTEQGIKQPVFKGLPQEIMAFHWHEDTFDIPSGATHLAYSEFCENQAFSYGNIMALQFHPEVNRELVQEFLSDPGMELVMSASVNSPEEMLADSNRFAILKDFLFNFLDNWIYFDGTDNT